MLVLEGPDCCGKTTVAKVLRDNLPGWSYRWHTRPPKDVGCYPYHTWFIADSHPRVVVDRAHWSGYVYGRVYGDQCQLTPQQWRCEELALMSRGTRVLLMIDESENIIKRWSERELYPPDKVPEICAGYNSLYNGWVSNDYKTRLFRRAYDLRDLVTAENRPTRMLTELITTAKMEAEMCSHLLPPSLGFGNPRPKFVVIGEQPGFTMEPKTPDDLPPQMPFDRGPASDYLWGAFDEIGLRWWEGYYTNASAFADGEQLGNYISSLQPEQVLTLGRRAELLRLESVEHTLTRDGLLWGNVDHPSYVLRFRSKSRDQWVAQIGAHLDQYCGAK
jgi:hypothetical protein